MYLLFRIVFICLLDIIFFIINKKYKLIAHISSTHNADLYNQYCNNKNYKIKYILKFIITVILLITIVRISFYPFEGYFLQFNSIEDALKYRGYNTQNLEIFEYDDCAFAFDKEDRKLYTFDKRENSYGFVNFNSVNSKYNEFETSYHYFENDYIYSSYNKTVNKTFYLINVRTDKDIIDDEIIINGAKAEFEKEIDVTYFKEINRTLKQYICIQDNQPGKTIDIIINNTQIEMVSSNHTYILGHVI